MAVDLSDLTGETVSLEMAYVWEQSSLITIVPVTPGAELVYEEAAEESTEETEKGPIEETAEEAAEEPTEEPTKEPEKETAEDSREETAAKPTEEAEGELDGPAGRAGFLLAGIGILAAAGLGWILRKRKKDLDKSK